MERRRRESLSVRLKAYWDSFTPQQRQEKCAHLHTPAIKAKARKNAERTYKSAQYRREQSRRMFKWHAGRRWSEEDRREFAAAVRAGVIRLYYRWVDTHIDGKPARVRVLDCDYPGKYEWRDGAWRARLPRPGTSARVDRMAGVRRATPKGRSIVL